MIPDALVEEVRARADIVELVGEHVALRRAGKDFRGLCPFHQEKTPSFYVVPAKGFYKCFGCGASGDVFAFLMQRLGLGFQEAVRHVAARVGVELPDAAGPRGAREAHAPLYEAMAFAADFYARQLREERVGEAARRYLAGRGLGDEAIERFRIGFAPPEWRALREAARRHGIEDAVLLEAGLLKASGRGGEPYDRLRGRIVFPILDLAGRVVALGGRVLGPAEEGVPKYLNSPETPIYRKGQALYGLYWARPAIRRAGTALVVEGYLDYISLAARGIEHVVAPLGTALTPEQAGLIARYARRAVLLYDSDPAGLRATFRAADELLRAGVHPHVASLPAGEDPDSLVRAGGAAALEPYLAAAVDVVERKLQILEERGYFRDIDGKRKALDGLLPTLRAASDPALRDLYVARVAERTGVRRETLERALAGGRAAPRVRRAGGAPAGETAGPGAGLAAERLLLLLLLRDPDRIPAAAEALRAEELRDPVHRALFEELVRSGGLRGRDPAALELGEAARRRLEELLGDPTELADGDRIFADAVAAIRAEGLFERLDELERRMAEAEGGEEAQRLLRERAEVAQALRSMGYKVSRRWRTLRWQARRERRGPSADSG